jgi:type II secretory pathway component PulM
MMVGLRFWWRARSSRERLMLSGGFAIIVCVVAPLALYFQVDTFRRAAATDLAAARVVLSDVGKIAAAGPPKAASGDVRDVAAAAAATSGLTISRIEPTGVGGLVLVFGVSDSRGVYQWMDAMGASGFSIRRSNIVRVDDGALVTAEFEIGGRR